MMNHNLWVRLQGDVMDRVNLPFFLDLGAILKNIGDIVQVTKYNRLDCLLAGLRLSPQVKGLLDSYPELTVCRSLGMKLLTDIENLMTYYRDATQEERDSDDPATNFRYSGITALAREFETVLTAELSTLGVYQVAPKGIFSTPALIDYAENAFGDDVKNVLNNTAALAIDDTNQAGRCLALDLPTASGFHIMRGRGNRVEDVPPCLRSCN